MSTNTVQIINEKSGFEIDQVVEFTPYIDDNYIYVSVGKISRKVLKEYVRSIDSNGKLI